MQELLGFFHLAKENLQHFHPLIFLFKDTILFPVVFQKEDVSMDKVPLPVGVAHPSKAHWNIFV